MQVFFGLNFVQPISSDLLLKLSHNYLIIWCYFEKWFLIDFTLSGIRIIDIKLFQRLQLIL